MHRSTLPFLWAVAAALGVWQCEGFANPSHGGAHPSPKPPPPASKGHHANAKGSKPGNTGGNAHAKLPGNTGGHTGATSNPSTANASKHVITFPQGDGDAPHHPNQHKDAVASKSQDRAKDKGAQRKDWHKEKELQEQQLQKDLARLATMEAELARDLQRLQDHHRHNHFYAMNNGNMSNPYQQQYGQQFPYSQQQGGQGGQQRPSQSQNGSTGDQDSGQSQVAQEDETPGTEPRHAMSGDALQYAENLLAAAIHQMQEAFAHMGEHRHHEIAEANSPRHERHDDQRRMEYHAHMMRTYEHPRMEADREHRKA